MRPDCPKCMDNFGVRSKRGGSKHTYCYTCLTCRAEWQQFPPNSEHVLNGGDPGITYPKQRDKPSTCSKCGACPKKGHSCPYSMKRLREEESTTNNTFMLLDAAFTVKQDAFAFQKSLAKESDI